MRTVRLLSDMSGYRPDGARWPAPGTVLDITDSEYDALSRATPPIVAEVSQTASESRGGTPESQVPAETAAAEAQDAVTAEAVPEAAPVVSAPQPWGIAALPGQAEPPAIEQAPPVQETTEPAKTAPPWTTQPKADWVDFAVTQGMSRDEAARLPKSDLVSRFGRG